VKKVCSRDKENVKPPSGKTLSERSPLPLELWGQKRQRGRPRKSRERPSCSIFKANLTPARSNSKHVPFKSLPANLIAKVGAEIDISKEPEVTERESDYKFVSAD